jgi:transposase
MSRRSRYPQELRERVVRMVQEHRAESRSEWGPITSIAGKLGVGREALRLWLGQARIDQHHRAGATTADRERMRELERMTWSSPRWRTSTGSITAGSTENSR